jgi:hypothetical protein
MFFIVFNFIWFQLERKLVLQRALSEGYNADRLVCDLFCISFVDSLQARSTWISFLFVDCKRVRWQLNCNRICDNVRTWTIWQAKLPEMMTLKGQALCRRTGGKSRVKRFSDKKEKEKRKKRDVEGGERVNHPVLPYLRLTRFGALDTRAKNQLCRTRSW